MGSAARQGQMYGISTGEPQLDGVLGDVKGYPLGRVIEIAGAPRTRPVIGQLTLLALREAQRAGQRAMLIDASGEYDAAAAEAAGVDTERLVVVRPSSLDEAMGVLRATLEARVGKLAVVVVHMIDDLATPPQGDMGLAEATFDVERRSFGRALDRVASLAYQQHTAVLFTAAAEPRFHRGGTLRHPGSPLGGDTLRHWASLRIEIRLTSEPDALTAAAHVTKTKAPMSKPYVSAALQVVTVSESGAKSAAR